jgi:small nuclear ribonucleoprotein (snRNP)-like protein
MRKIGWTIVFVLVIFSFVSTSELLAQQKPDQEKRIAFHPADAPQAILERHVGKSVTLKLDSGHELSGIVREVGNQMVYLSELAGKEFYDALVRIDRISAVIIRARSR